MSDSGRHAEKSKKSKKLCEILSIRNGRNRRNENGGVRPGLASGLGRIRHSLPLIGAEQRWWFAMLTVGRREKYYAHRTQQQLIAIPNSYSRIQTYALSKPSVRIQKDSDTVVGSITTNFRSNQINLNDIVSRDIDNKPIPKDYLDIKYF